MPLLLQCIAMRLRCNQSCLHASLANGRQRDAETAATPLAAA
jgi:hypothetical protein